jgi:hypothetical protein
MRHLYTPIAEIEAPTAVEVALRRKAQRRMLHLVNTTGMQVAGDYSTVDVVPSVGPLRLRIRMKRKPRSVVLEPGATRPRGRWESGIWSGVVPRLDIHAALTWEE